MIQLFKGRLPVTFGPTAWFLLTGAKIPLEFQFTTSAGPTRIDYYLEFTDDPTLPSPITFREVDEQDVGNGVVTMSKVIRTFQENNGGFLQNGVHNLSCQLLRLAPIARLQIQASAGTATAIITASSGELIVAP